MNFQRIMKTVSIMLTLFAFMFIGCNQKIGKVHEHETSDLEPLAYTIYSDNTELFVEFMPLIVGRTSNFAAHFTVLGEYFLPLKEAKVTVSLVMGKNGIRNSSDTASSPGIFRLALQPKLPGIGKLVFDIVTKEYTDKLVIDNVTVYSSEQEAIENQDVTEKSDDITYLKEQAWKVGFANVQLTKQVFNEIVKTSGQVLSAPGDEIMVTANTSGSVLFSGTKTKVGSVVHAGTNLFAISGGNISTGTIDASYKVAKVNYEKAKADYERSVELSKDNIISQREYLQSKVAFENAQTTYNVFAKNYSAKGQTISSPMDGFVKNILVAEGQYVEAGTPLAIISKNKKLMLQANVSQRYFRMLSTIANANFSTAGSDVVYETQKLNGKIVSYGKSAQANSPFIPLTFEFDNIGNIIAGSVAEVYLKSSPIPNALVVSKSALIEEQGKYYVYVQTGGESFQKREVEIGAGDGIHVQLLSGVVEGERVVTKGAYQIKLSTASGTLPAHGHEH
ncbi:MAG: cobalt-zinc-cadmium efflux system membrane fusion protein [Bacteroidia bacterium]|jgi:cobalt-zinc-cadmium efflux system membrane fusion protein